MKCLFATIKCTFLVLKDIALDIYAIYVAISRGINTTVTFIQNSPDLAKKAFNDMRRSFSKSESDIESDTELPEPKPEPKPEPGTKCKSECKATCGTVDDDDEDDDDDDDDEDEDDEEDDCTPPKRPEPSTDGATAPVLTNWLKNVFQLRKKLPALKKHVVTQTKAEAQKSKMCYLKYKPRMQKIVQSYKRRRDNGIGPRPRRKCYRR
ncbi:nucleolin-like, partial [Hyposmocoma kahamanoa]|uniref:nucleolin-like n=1 Tax=Hyposmocoma kahamanoa TaxID=1477025 RepID=UPI000E6D6467